jgi:hypothetical protein
MKRMPRLEGQNVPNHQDTVRPNPSPWFLGFWIVVGVALDWRCAFEAFAEKSPFYSELVVGRAVLIVLACAGTSLLAVWVTRTRWRDAWLLFSILSIVLYRLLVHHWTAHW